MPGEIAATPAKSSSPTSVIDLLMIGPYPEWDMDPLQNNYVVHKLWECDDWGTFLADNGHNIRAVATRGELGASGELIRMLPRLEIIACYGVGTDAIDLNVARERNIRVTNTPLVLNKDVADMALGLTLGVLRRIPEADRYVRNGSWVKRNMELTTSLTGKRLGILGFGRIGHEVAKRARAFDMQVGYHDRRRDLTSDYDFLDSPTALGAWSDVLVVTVSGGAATRHIVDSVVLEGLGPQGVLINVSRGSTVDQDALIRYLQEKKIAGAGLDVFASEPAIDQRLMTLENVLLQPHHSSGTVETRKAMGQLVRDNLKAHFSQQPLLTPVV